jgi:hypothetical protein
MSASPCRDTNCPDDIVVYSAKNIRENKQVALSEGGLLLLALLCGGDYHVRVHT